MEKYTLHITLYVKNKSSEFTWDPVHRMSSGL